MGELFRRAHEPTGRFDQSLQQQHARQDRKRGKVIGQILLGERHTLDGRKPLARFQRHNFVY